MLAVPDKMSSKAIYFYNWTEYPFTYPWNNEPYSFEPKQRMLFPEGIAYHFAKHLAEEFYNRVNKSYNLAELQIQIDKGLIREGGIEEASDEKMRILSMNQPIAPVVEAKAEEKPKKKIGRPKKVAVEPVKDDLAQFEGK